MRRPLLALFGSLSVASAADPLPPAEEARRDALTRFGVGLIRARNDQIATAVKEFEAAAKQTPDAAGPHKELAKLYAELGREPAAVRAGEKALSLNPDDLDTAKLLGRLYADARRPADAVRVLKLAADNKSLTDPVAKLLVLKELAKAADAADDPTSAASARTAALAVYKADRVKLLHPDYFTAAEIDRERAKLYEGLGHAHLRKKEHAAAAAAYDTARDLCKLIDDPAGVARLHWNLAELRRAEGEPAKALAELKKYLALRPAAFSPYERYSELLRATGEGVEKSLREAADANRTNPAPRWLLAAERMAARPADADGEFRALVGGKDASADGARVMVAAYRATDRPKELLDHLDRLYKAARPRGFDEPGDGDLDPADADAVARGRLLTDAVRHLKPSFTKRLIAIADGSRHADTLELLSGLAERDGELPAMADVLKAAAAARPKEYRLKGLRVNALHRLRRWTELAAEATALSQSEPGRFFPGIVLQAAIAYAEQGKRAEALAAFKRNKDVGETPYTQQMRARVFNILGDHKDALAECEAGLANPRLSAGESRGLLQVKATTLDHLGKHADAEAIWREMLAADPDDVQALNNLGYNLADQNRELAEAEGLLRRAVELDKWERTRAGDPDATSGGYADSLAWVLLRRGKLKEARGLLEEAVSRPDSADSAIVWDHLGDVAFRQGEKKRAAEAWRKAVGLYTGSSEGRLHGRLDEAKKKLALTE